MPRQEHVLSIFVASPSDVADERERLEEVIRELNMTWSRALGVCLELIRWETHALPGIGDDPQDVINQQIPADYDIFIGLMWHRFGTPTGRAGSGTAEEFQRAKARHESSPSSVSVMFYFKDAPVAPSTIDADQLRKVTAFRYALGAEGVLYWRFFSLEHFEKLVRLHLARQLQSWYGAGEKENWHAPKEAVNATSNDDPYEHLPFRELLELFEDRFAELVRSTENLTTATLDLAKRTVAHTAEIDALVQQREATVDRAYATRIFDRSAADMDQYTARIAAELPLFSRAAGEGLTAMTRALAMSLEPSAEPTTKDDAAALCVKVRELHEVLIMTEGQLEDFRAAVGSIPTATGRINSARRRVVAVLDQMLLQFVSSRSLVAEVQKSANELLTKTSKATLSCPAK